MIFELAARTKHTWVYLWPPFSAQSQVVQIEQRSWPTVPVIHTSVY
jgi:hypothetical protein